MQVSVIVPIYNEENVIIDFLKSLTKQTRKVEIIVVDDGSTDNSLMIVGNIKSHSPAGGSNLKLLKQIHKGPGAARNLGVTQAKGGILVFVDADMTFAPEFVEELIEQIEAGKSKGTFTKKEYVANWDNVWARCWNYNQGISERRRILQNYPDTAPVFRAILASEFRRVGGFTEGMGWTDDWSLSKKLGYEATSTDATCYHKNPGTLIEVFDQARWIGKNEFLRSSVAKILFNFVRFSPPVSLINGLNKSIRYREPKFIFFKLVYDFGAWFGFLNALGGGQKYK